MRLNYLDELFFNNKFLLKNLLEKDLGNELFKSKVSVIQELNSFFPNSSEEDKMKIIHLLSRAYFRSETEKTQLIWSGPSVSGLPGRDTELVFEEYIKESRNSIIITVYSISGYAVKLIDLLKKKAKQGVFIEIYVNDFQGKRKLLEEMVTIDPKRVFVYDYTGASNQTQALHAKVLTVDDTKAIVTSSNLSYNGMDGNLELGVVIDSKEKAREIRAIFNSLIEKRYFKRIRIV